MKPFSFFGGVCVFTLSMAFCAPAFATDKFDIEAGLKVLPLLANKITGDTAMAIVYDPANAASETDAENIKSIVDSGVFLPNKGKLSAILVSVGELSKLSRVKIAYLTPGLTAHLADINTATSAASILTFSTDLECIKAAKCIIGVATQPNLSIYYSKAAADSAKIEFSQAFVLLVKEL